MGSRSFRNSRSATPRSMKFAKHQDRRSSRLDDGQLSDVIAMMNVFIHHQTHKIRVLGVIVEGGAHQLAKGFSREEVASRSSEASNDRMSS